MPAFTLAEVLITLAVIGIVAALTIPTLVQKYQQHIFVNKVKQTYSIVSNALMNSVAENGPPRDWLFVNMDGKDPNYVQNFSNHMKLTATKYFKPYLQTVGEGHENFGYYLILKNGVTLYFYPQGYFNNNTDKIFIQSEIYIIGSINNNHSFFLDSSRDYSKKDFVIDIKNSYDNAKVNFYTSNFSIYDCSKSNPPNKRLHCGAFLQQNGWRITKDYPWD